MASTKKVKNTKADETVYSSYGEASAAEIHTILEACWKASMPLGIISAPGCGKTSLIRSWSLQKFGTEPMIVLGSTSDPTDISGLPSAGKLTAPDGKEFDTTNFLAPFWQVEVCTGGSKVLFLDEFSNSSPTVQAALLSLIQDRVTPSGYRIPADVAIVLAMNPEDSAADYNAMTAPMANRICFVSYRPTDSEVYEGMVGGWFSEEEKANWTQEEKNWRQRIVGFLKSTNGAYILKENTIGTGYAASENAAWMNPDNENSSSEREILTTAWASPRAWDNVARILGNTPWDNKQVTPLQERILNGTVGRVATVALTDYTRAHSFVDPFEIIRDPSIQQWDVSSADTQYNDVLELARMVNDAVPRCDGKDGRPTPAEALDFYSKVVDCGGGPHFMTAFCQDQKGPRAFFAQNCPEDVTLREWNSKIIETVTKYAHNGLIPTEDRGTGKKAGQGKAKKVS